MNPPGRAVAVPLQADGSLGQPIALGFTPREYEILRLIASDRSDKQIAQALQISPHTLRTHLSRLYRRHGVHSRAAAVAAWLGFRERLAG
jgi:DNA-binding CsgD family transcriptional regulator